MTQTWTACAARMKAATPERPSRLTTTRAGVHRTLTSTENGQYRFDRLLAGTYTLTVTLPESAMFTLPDGDSQFTGGYAFSQSISIGVSTAKPLPCGPSA